MCIRANLVTHLFQYWLFPYAMDVRYRLKVSVTLWHISYIRECITCGLAKAYNLYILKEMESIRNL